MFLMLHFLHIFVSHSFHATKSFFHLIPVIRSSLKGLGNKAIL